MTFWKQAITRSFLNPCSGLYLAKYSLTTLLLNPYLQDGNQ